jgi:hypothetical protein
MRVKILKNGRSARLLEDITIETPAGKITIPAGFKTDFASVPRAFWSIIPPWGKYSEAALVHDYLYSAASKAIKSMSRKEADDIFLELMKEAGVPWWQRQAIYWAVRMWGKSYWKT